MEMNATKFGLSKKTNIAIACMGFLTMVQDSMYAIIAVSVIGFTGIVCQFIIDRGD